MIDNLALALSHALMLLGAWLLIRRPDLNDDSKRPDADAAKPDA